MVYFPLEPLFQCQPRIYFKIYIVRQRAIKNGQESARWNFRAKMVVPQIIQFFMGFSITKTIQPLGYPDIRKSPN